MGAFYHTVSFSFSSPYQMQNSRTTLNMIKCKIFISILDIIPPRLVAFEP